VHNTD